MKKVLLFLLFALIPLVGFADATTTVNVPNNCTVVDTDSVSHPYSGYLGICALQTAIDNGSAVGVQFSNAFPALGLFAITIGGVTADPNSQYWALYQNDSYATLGLSQLPVTAGDTLKLELHDFSDAYLGSRLAISIASLAAPAPPAPIGGGIPSPRQFDIPLAISYLSGKQHADGSFDSVLLSDWAAIAFAGGDAGDAQKKLRAYFASTTPALSTVTDYERHAMALEALGINPYDGAGTDHIAHIIGAFDGTQFGDTSLVNDDIFALFPLLHAGYGVSDEIIQKSAAFIISKQSANGSWENSVDLTAATIQALTQTTSVPGATQAISKAREYLKSKQQANGGFGDEFATSWALQAISSLGEPAMSWIPAALNPKDYLGNFQQADGSVGLSSGNTQSTLWATEYAIPAIEGKSWNSLLQTFPKPIPVLSASITTTSTISTTTTGVVEQEEPPMQPITAIAAPRPTNTAPGKNNDETISAVPQNASESASVASASGNNFFVNIWQAITSFFARVF